MAPSESADTVKDLGLKELRMRFFAYKRARINKYKNLCLYIDRVEVREGALAFEENYKWPTPSAKLETEGKIKAFTFDMINALHSMQRGSA